MGYKNANQVMNDFQERVNEQIAIQNAKPKEKFTKDLLARKANISKSTLETYFLSDSPSMPSFINVRNIADALDVSMDYLAGDDMVSKIPTPIMQTAQVLLKNLCTVIAKTNLRVEVEENGTVVFSTNNVHIRNFVNQIENYNDKENVDLVIKQFSSLMVVNGELVDPHTRKKRMEKAKRQIENAAKNAFIYDAIVNGKPHHTLKPLTEEDFTNFPDETNEEVIRRAKAWDDVQNKKKAQYKEGSDAK